MESINIHFILDDQPWNDSDGIVDDAENEKLPPLRAVIYDFSAVSYLDTSGFQALIDIRKAVGLYFKYLDEQFFNHDMILN